MPLSEATYAELERAGRKIEQEAAEREERERRERGPRKVLEFYVCPEQECPGYYGSPHMDDTGIATDWTGLWGQNSEVLPEHRARKRSDCGICFEAGRGRVPMNRIRIEVDPGQKREPEARPTSGRFAA